VTNRTASAQVLTVDPFAARMETVPVPLKEYCPRLFHFPAFCNWLTLIVLLPSRWTIVTGTTVAREDHPDHHMNTSYVPAGWEVNCHR
jgi:hypothetical protein